MSNHNDIWVKFGIDKIGCPAGTIIYKWVPIVGAVHSSKECMLPEFRSGRSMLLTSISDVKQ